MNIHKKIAAVKKELSETNIPKTGLNRHLKFKYHELADFLTHITKLNEKHGLNEVVSVNNDLATLTIHDTENDTCVAYTVPFVMADMQPKNDSIQKLGAALTYLRRYLYVQAYGITENDSVDAQPPKAPEPKTNHAKALFMHAVEVLGTKELAETVLKSFLTEVYNHDSLKTFDFAKHAPKAVYERFDKYIDEQHEKQEQMKDLGV